MKKKILVSRVDNMGDVVLTLPVGGCLKKIFPDAEIHFLVKSYTLPVAKLSKSFDHFLLWDELENKSDSEIVEQFKEKKYDIVIHVYPVKRIAQICYNAAIPIRIGTGHRFFHWRFCNKLSFFSRKSSNLHESQLNLKLLTTIVNDEQVNLDLAAMKNYLDIDSSIVDSYQEEVSQYLSDKKFNLIIHPKSLGSALEWPISSYRELIEQLDLSKYNVIVTGTKNEEVHLEMEFLNPLRGMVTSCVGKLKVEGLIALMSKADGVIAASTGPLHLGSILGLYTLGLYPNKRPMFPLRWLPIGPKVSFLLSKKSSVMSDISTKQVLKKMSIWDKLLP